MLAEKTVRNNITSIFAKLNVTDRAAAVVRARDAGLGLDGTGPGNVGRLTRDFPQR